jgi:hypothetical protein
METTLPRLRAVLDGVERTDDYELLRIAENHKARRTAIKQAAYKRLMGMRKPTEFLQLVREASDGRPLAIGKLREAVSSGDFPLLFQSISQASMLGQWSDLPQQWPAFSQRTTVPDFRPARLVRWDSTLEQLPDSNGGAERHVRALPRIPELTEYPTFNLTTEGQDYFVNKYGARFPFSWEAFLNDELNVLQQLPAQMAKWARDTEDVLTTGVLATSTGPNPDFFKAPTDPGAWNFGSQVPLGNYVAWYTGGGNQVVNPPLTLDNLEKAIQSIAMRTLNGRSVRVPQFALVVPPSLALTAHEIAQATTYMRVTTDGAGNEIRINVSSPVAGRFTVVESQWLPQIDRSATSATTWYLVPAGGMTERGPAIVTAFLRGYETPEVRAMGDTGQRVGGGEISPYEGSFSHDDIQYRVRTIIGAAGIDPSAVAVSKGNSVGTIPEPEALMGGMTFSAPQPQAFVQTTENVGRPSGSAKK